ncbi:DUF6443 domain-containing protein [Kordia algicida OT-1]|uniref:Putative cell wall-associated protein n=1 Tax=Kordia algicida OT-1 TaxID=391587 RepID=A9DQB4_9FLAO|nr:DUF6443 domain-containing protein [Kordia algicida]EDP96618.1 putative cell wall-associated protein precursor [Kordia algicida OT-1]
MKKLFFLIVLLTFGGNVFAQFDNPYLLPIYHIQDQPNTGLESYFYMNTSQRKNFFDLVLQVNTMTADERAAWIASGDVSNPYDYLGWGDWGYRLSKRVYISTNTYTGYKYIEFEKYYKDADLDGYGNKNEYSYFFKVHAAGYSHGGYEPGISRTFDDLVLYDMYGNSFNETKIITSYTDVNNVKWVNNNFGFDCNDTNANLPTNVEIYYLDFDNDGYGGSAVSDKRIRLIGCPDTTEPYSATSPNNEDCNSYDVNVTTAPINWYYDGDNDGYGDVNIFINSCTQPSQYVINSDDCNDTNAMVNITPITWYADGDDDGFGDLNDTIQSCYKPEGYITNCYFDECPTETGTRNNGCTQITYDFDNDSQNYIYERVYKSEVQKDELENVIDNDLLEKITYFDGLNRSQQQNFIKSSPLGKDIITHQEYNGNGEVEKEYLPYVSTTGSGLFDVNSLANTNNYYDTAEYENTTNPYTQVIRDDSPLNLILEAGAPGDPWKVDTSSDNDHTNKRQYELNTSSTTDVTDNVKMYKVNHIGDNIENPQLIYNGLYPSSSLRKTITKDENWNPNLINIKDHTKEIFQDKQGRTVLERAYNGEDKHDTYYVYDDFGNLTYVLPPLVASNTSINTNDLNKLCYQYKYDYRNRVIERRIPAKGIEYIVYDRLDRPVLTQDANLRAENKWLFTKYDRYDRVVYTGIYINDDHISDVRLNAAAEENVFESKTTTVNTYNGTNIYYTANVYPQGDEIIDILTINYFDDYSWDSSGSLQENSDTTKVGITQNGNILEKTSSTSWTNAGLLTDATIEGDGYVEYTVTQADKRVMVGLSHIATASATNYSSIDYRIYTGYGGLNRVYVYNGSVIESFPATYFEIGDTFKIERFENQVLFKKNEEVFHAVTTDYSGELIGSASFCENGTKIENLHIGYSTYGNEYSNNTKGLLTGSKIRTLDTNKWETLTSYYDEERRIVHVTSFNEYLDTHETLSNRLDFVGTILEAKTTHKKSNGSLIITNDEFVFDKNLRLLYQTKQINNENKQLITRNNFNDLGQLIKKQVGGVIPKISTYTNENNVTVTDNLITKNGSNGWDGALTTSNSITGDGYLSYNVPFRNSYAMVGLADTVGNSSYSSIDYAINTTAHGIVRVYENGSNRGDKTTYVAGDEFTIERRDAKIYYAKNGEVFYVSEINDIGNTLLGDISIYTSEGKIKDLVLVDLEKELQEVDYTYNIRGWLKGINQNYQSNDLFSFLLTYNNIYDPNKALFDGNISSTSWRTRGQNTTIKSYVYDYDALNRIVKATDNTGRYNLEYVNYDLNGNIIKLERKGHLDEEASSFGTMDALDYKYDGNQLSFVDDTSASQYGFNDGNTVGNDFEYDANGNLIVDKNKKIESISYNHLNLPKQILFQDGSEISYVYDALGEKLEKEIRNNTSSTSQQTFYAGNYIYKDTTPESLIFFNTEEGYVEPKFNTTDPTLLESFHYTFQYKDHLGNIRLSYEDMNLDGSIDFSTEIKEENHYYPFGLKHKGYNGSIVGRDHNYGFNGIEESNDGLGLDMLEMDFRQYDYALGRWMVLDPVIHYNYSPYQAFDNNPIYFADPSGADSEGDGDDDFAWANLINPEELDAVTVIGTNRNKMPAYIRYGFEDWTDSSDIYGDLTLEEYNERYGTDYRYDSKYGSAWSQWYYDNYYKPQLNSIIKHMHDGTGFVAKIIFEVGTNFIPMGWVFKGGKWVYQGAKVFIRGRSVAYQGGKTLATKVAVKTGLNKKVMYPIIKKSIGADTNKLFAKLAKIANNARYAKGKQGSELLQKLAKKAGFELENGAKHIKVFDEGQLFTTIPYSAKGNNTNRAIIKAIMDRAGF